MITAKSLMNSTVITAGPQGSINETIGAMVLTHVGGLPVVDESNVLVGLLRRKDIIRYIRDSRRENDIIKADTVEILY